MSLHLPAAAYDAMAKQKRRAQQPRTLQDDIDDLRAMLTKAERERDNALAEVKRLNAENDQLALKAHRARKTSADGSSEQSHDGIAYVNQAQAAAILDVGQYAISRWVKAGKFQMIAVPGAKRLQIVTSSLYKPERGTPGRKKK